jgi:hypothetical protein
LFSRKGAKREIWGKGMNENEIAKEIVDAAYSIHITLGPGLLESVYEVALAFELKQHLFAAYGL